MSLAGGPRVPGPVESKNQRLVVGQHMDLSPLQQKPEMTQGGHHHQELPVEGAVPGLQVGQLPAEEGEGLPLTAGGPLLQGHSYMVVASIYCQGELCLLDGGARWAASVRATLG